jgi:hypothetical protein
MPYERWGFSLLPGANGQTTPDASHSAQTAPPGTVWASEPTGSRPLDALVDPLQAMQSISSAARAPLPGATRMMPSAPVAPNMMRGATLRPGLYVDMTPTGSIGPVDGHGSDDMRAGLPGVLGDAARAQSFAPGTGDVPELALRATRFAPARKEEADAAVIAWRATVAHILERLGAPLPQERLGPPFCAAGEAQPDACAPAVSTPTPIGPPEQER